MKVGDLVRLVTHHHLLSTLRPHGQLAVIIRYDEEVYNPWKVKVINGGEIWLKSHELELV
jgi:hypothetical protein